MSRAEPTYLASLSGKPDDITLMPCDLFSNPILAVNTSTRLGFNTVKLQR
jgi:hypothetical protein